MAFFYCLELNLDIKFYEGNYFYKKFEIVYFTICKKYNFQF